jgi:hypothetical protein
MAGTTGLEPATSAVTGQRSNQLSYVPRRRFYNLFLSHRNQRFAAIAISLISALSPLWTQSEVPTDTVWTQKQTPQPPTQRQDKVYQTEADLVSIFPGNRAKLSDRVRFLKCGNL